MVGSTADCLVDKLVVEMDVLAVEHLAERSADLWARQLVELRVALLAEWRVAERDTARVVA